MHIDAEPGAEVFVEGRFVGAAPVDVDVSPGVEAIRLRVDDRGKSYETVVSRTGIAPSTYGASAIAGVTTAAASLTSIGVFNAYLSDVRNDSAQSFNAQLCAGVIQWGCMPFLCAAAAGFTAAAIAAPIGYAGEEPPASLRVDVEKGRVDY